VRIGGHAGRGRRGDGIPGDERRGDGRRRAWRARAFLTAAALTAVTFTAGCAALGTSAAGGPPPATARATATGSPGPAAAAHSATLRSSARPHKTTATPSRASSVMPARTGPAVGGTLTPTAPAASEPPPPGAAGQPVGDQRRVTFVNQTAQTIWVAAAPNANTPLAATGWVLPAGQSVTITTPNNLNTRFWGRTGCVFNSAGVGHCETGDCGDRFQCKGWGTIPATLAEVNFDASRSARTGA